MEKRIYIKNIVLLILVSLLGFDLAAQESFNLIREEITIPMRDGIRLGAIVYRPDTDKKLPAIVYRTPYGVDDYDSYAEFPIKAARRGYVVFLVDVRGRYRSEGEFEAYRNEKKDGYDVIEWVAQSSYCNEQVATYGGSYPGIVQWLAMSEHPPHLVAAAPEMTPISSHHFFYYGGAFSLPWLDWFVPYVLPDKRKRANDKTGEWDETLAAEVWENSNRRQWYLSRPLADLPIFENYAPEYFEWLRHPDLSDWWDFVNTEKEFKNFKIPVFLLSGWYDAAYGPEGATRAFNKMQKEAATEKARNNTRLILGPWNHTSLNSKKTHFGEVEFGAAAGMDYDLLLLDWFDEQIKGKGDIYPYSKVNIFVMGSNKWRSFEEWPLTSTQATNFYLSSNGKVALDKKAGQLTLKSPLTENADTYVFDPADPFWDKSYEKSYPYDQRANESRKDVLVYTSDPLDADLEIIGEIVAELYVSSSAKDTDFSITLSDVSPDGTSINLSSLDAGYLRMRYRNGFEKQELMKPDEVYKIRIGQLYTANVFQKGHRIRLAITSSKAPHYDPNPNTGREIATEKEVQSCNNTIYIGGKYPSKIILPVFAK